MESETNRERHKLYLQKTSDNVRGFFVGGLGGISYIWVAIDKQNIPLDMKTKIILILFIFIGFSCSVAFSQKAWFREDFNNNDNKWKIQNGDQYTDYKIEKGHYAINNYDTQKSMFWNSKNIYMNRNKPFKLSSKIKFNSIVESGGGGIYIYENGNKYTSFIINPIDKKIWIGFWENNNWTIYTQNSDWEKVSNINGLGEYNELSIEKMGNEILFKLNGSSVLSLDASTHLTYIQSYIGTTVFAQLDMEIDYIEFDQDNWDDVLLPDTKIMEAVKLPKTINSTGNEVKATLSSKSNLIFFNRTDYEGNFGGNTELGDIYSSNLINGEWSEAENLGRGVNDEKNNGVCAISPDGNSLLVKGHYDNTEFDMLYFINKTKSGWSKPEKLNIKNFYNKNPQTNYFLASDWSTLILCIERDDSEGAADFYVSFRNQDDSWSEPKHMGKNLSTKNLDFSPFLASDGKTLYFASFDLPGYGSSDMFMSKRLDDSYTKWSDPKNMGPSINDDGFNAYYSISADGKTVMYSSTKNSNGGSDLFMSELPKELQSEQVLIISGHVYNSDTKEPISANINYYSLAKNEKLGQTISNPQTGYYSIVLPIGIDIGFLANADSFISVSENVDASLESSNHSIERDLLLVPIKEGITVRLNNIFFDYNKFDLKSESYNELDRLVNLLNTNKSMVIEITGHTDDNGDDKYNLKLSDNRSKSVYDYLVGKNISANRLSFKGLGETKPVASNKTDEGRKLNRRVEFYIVKN